MSAVKSPPTANNTSKKVTKKRRFNPATFLLMLCMFASGACGLVMEYIQATVATYILGNSIEQFGVVIGLMLFMMGIAGAVQSLFKEERLVEIFIFIEILLALTGGYAPTATYWAYGVMNDHFLLVQYFFIMSVGFLIGLEIPVILRINETYSEKLSTNIGQVLSADYIGSLAGALLWVFYLLRRFPLTEISFILSGVNFLIAVFTYGFFRRRQLIDRNYLINSLIILTAIGIIFGCQNNRSWNKALLQHLYEDPIVLSKTTQYQHLVMTRNRRLNEYRFYINGNLQFSSIDEARYHEMLVHPVMTLVPDHTRILILGGGDGLALREVLKYSDVEEVTLVDLDPQMVRLCANHPVLRQLNKGAFDDARVIIPGSAGITPGDSYQVWQETGKELKNKLPETEQTASVQIMNIDADKYLARAGGNRRNAVLVDLPDPSSPELVKLYSKEFYLKIHRILSEKGMMAVQSTSPYHAKESFLCIRRTIESAGFETLPMHLNIPSFGDWGWIIAWKSPLGKEYVKRKIQSLTFNVPTRFLTPDVFRSTMVFGKGMLDSKHQSISTLMHPVLLDYYLRESWLVE